VRFDQIAPGNALACPSCSATIRFSGQDLRRVQEAVTRLSRELGDASVKVTVQSGRRPWWKFWGR
jgi:hypothetical protein